MADAHSRKRGRQLAPPDVRRKALEMLRSRRLEALSDVERLLGWTKLYGMPDRLMAEQLGITGHQLRYMLFSDKYRRLAKERRDAAKRARSIEYTTYTSDKLRFSISYPSNWKVHQDRLETEPTDQRIELRPKQMSVEELYDQILQNMKASVISKDQFKKLYRDDKAKAYKEFCKRCLLGPTNKVIEDQHANRDLSADEAYTALMDHPETFFVSFEEFKHTYEMGQKRGKGNELLAQMEVGYFEASPHDDEDYPCAEVTKLELTSPMSALNLYGLDKPNPEAVPQANRPAKGMEVDGLTAVKYFFIFDTGETSKMWEMPKFFNVYLAKNDEGWIISCSCKEEAFNNYKPVFEHIIRSFRRT